MGKKNKNRSIASFNQVASAGEQESQKKINNNANINEKENNKDIENDGGSLSEILKEKENKSKTHILKGIYFEKDVARAIDRVTRGKGKGAKSDIVNRAVKEAFKREGWL